MNLLNRKTLALFCLVVFSACNKSGSTSSSSPAAERPVSTKESQTGNSDSPNQPTPVACVGLNPSANSTVKGKRLSDASYLRKLSFHLRGIAPTSDEYSELERATDKEAYLNTKIDEYLTSPRYQDRMKFRLAERFRVRTFSNLPMSNPNDAMTDLFKRVAADNLSWDEIFTGTSYNAFPLGKYDFLVAGDFGFFRSVFPNLPDESRGTYDLNEKADPTKIGEPSAETPTSVAVEFAKDDIRVAGALTTARFMNRYANTALNKNRRRAAAVYNIALCDPMLPSVVTGNDPKHDFLDKSFANKFEVTPDDHSTAINATAESLHGSNNDCRACHVKLDPMGKTFQNFGTTFSPYPSQGALVIRRSTSDLHVEKVRGIGEMTRALVRQPEYVDCQTRYLWNEFIGEDVPVTKTRLEAMRCDFESVSRKTNDFVKKLVTSADFRIEPTDRGQLLFNNVKDLLKRCDACHANEEDIPMFSSLPILGSDGKDASTGWMKRIVKRMNLPETSDKRMPKDWKTNWSEDDLNKLRRWIGEGAKDENGTPMIEPTAPESLRKETK